MTIEQALDLKKQIFLIPSVNLDLEGNLYHC